MAIDYTTDEILYYPGYSGSPAAMDAFISVPSGSSWAYGTETQIIASTGADWLLLGYFLGWSSGGRNRNTVTFTTGTIAGTPIIDTRPVTNVGGSNQRPILFCKPVFVASGTQINCKIAGATSTATTYGVRLLYIPAAAAGSLSYTSNVLRSNVTTADGDTLTLGNSWANGSWVTLSNLSSAADDFYLNAVTVDTDITGEEYELDIGIGSTPTLVTTISSARQPNSHLPHQHLLRLLDVSCSGQAVKMRGRKSGTGTGVGHVVALEYWHQTSF